MCGPGTRLKMLMCKWDISALLLLLVFLNPHPLDWSQSLEVMQRKVIDPNFRLWRLSVPPLKLQEHKNPTLSQTWGPGTWSFLPVAHGTFPFHLCLTLTLTKVRGEATDQRNIRSALKFAGSKSAIWYRNHFLFHDDTVIYLWPNSTQLLLRLSYKIVFPRPYRGFPGGTVVKNLRAMQEM